MARKKFSELVDSIRWSALAAGLVGAAALSVAVWEGVETRRHNRLSVMPCLNFEELGSTAKNGKTIRGVTVRNKCLGPALIDVFELRVGDTSFVEQNRIWRKALKHAGLKADALSVQMVSMSGAFEAGESTDLGRIEGAFTMDQAIDIRITYRSIYDETFEESISWGPFATAGRQFTNDE